MIDVKQKPTEVTNFDNSFVLYDYKNPVHKKIVLQSGKLLLDYFKTKNANIPEELKNFKADPEILGLYIAEMFIDRNIFDIREKERSVSVFEDDDSDKEGYNSYLEYCAKIFVESLKIKSNKDIILDNILKLYDIDIRKKFVLNLESYYGVRLKGKLDNPDEFIKQSEFLKESTNNITHFIGYENEFVNCKKIYYTQKLNKDSIYDVLKQYNAEIKNSKTNDEKLDIILSLVSFLHNNHICVNGNTRASVTLLNMLLEQNGLEKCMMPHICHFCIHYVIDKKFNHDKRFDDYKNGVEHYKTTIDMLKEKDKELLKYRNQQFIQYIERGYNDFRTNNRNNVKNNIKDSRFSLEEYNGLPETELRKISNSQELFTRTVNLYGFKKPPHMKRPDYKEDVKNVTKNIGFRRGSI